MFKWDTLKDGNIYYNYMYKGNNVFLVHKFLNQFYSHNYIHKLLYLSL